MTPSPASLQLGLSALETAIDMIKRGRTERGVDLLNHGLEFLRDRIMARDQRINNGG